jgi:hypothetical protein
VGRNLNSPTFDGPTVNGTQYADVKMEPQVRAGVAWFPVRSVILEADLDLLPSSTLLPDHNAQYAALGFEWRTGRQTDFRLGTYRNLRGGDIGQVYTFGVGIGFLGGRLSLAGAWSQGTTNFPGTEIKLLDYTLMKDKLPVEASLNLDYTIWF